MNSKRLLLFPCILLILFGCRSEKVTDFSDTNRKIISLDLDQQQKAHAIIDEAIQLASTDESFFGRTQRIQFFEDRIYIFDPNQAKTLLLFDRAGNFIRKIPIGKGPGELVWPKAFYLDQEQGEVFIWDAGQRSLVIFDLDLNYIDTKPLPGIIIRQFEKLKDGSWLVFRRERILENGQDYAFYHYTENFDSIISSLLPIAREETSFMLSNPFSRERDQELLFTYQFQRNIYTLDENGEAKIKYTLDFGPYNIVPDDFSGSEPYDRPFVLMREGKRVASINQFINTVDYLAFSFVLASRWQFVIYNKHTEQYSYSGNLFNTGKLPHGRLMAVADGHFILVCERTDLADFCRAQDHDTPDYCQNAGKEGNVVLLLFELTKA